MLLHEEKCVACEGQNLLSFKQIEQLLAQLNPTWEIDQTIYIKRNFLFRNFWKTMAFVNAVAWIAHQENHHPKIEINFNSCLLAFTTHTLKHLSRNDFICAAKVNQLIT